MSSASEFKEKAREATIYEVIGRSGTAYVIFWFKDGSVTATRKRPAIHPQASAELVFEKTKPCLDDCGVDDVEGNTYQKGQELLKRIEG